MSNRRSIVFFLLLLVSAVAANCWLDAVRKERVEVVRRASLVPDADEAVSFVISKTGGTALGFERRAGWRIVRPFEDFADQAGVVRMLDYLAFEPLTDSMDDKSALGLGLVRSDFGLDPAVFSLRLSFSGKETTVKFGKAAGSADGYYAAVEGISSVYIVPAAVYAAVSRPVDAWRSRSVLKLSPEEVVSIDIRKKGSASMRIERRGERWEVTEPRKAMASPTAVKRIIDTVLGCEADRFVWPVGASNETAGVSVALLTGYGLDPESCETVVFRSGDGTDHAVSFGGAAESGEVYALIHGGKAVATVVSAAKESICVDAGALVEGRLFPVEKNEVRRISIADGDAVYLLARGENGRWRLDSPVSAAADDKAVESLVEKLLVMRTADVEEDGVKVSLSGDSPAVSVAREAFLGEYGFEGLRSKTMLELDAATVKRIVISSADAEKPESGVFDPDRKVWNVESSVKNRSVDPDRLERFLFVLSPLRAGSVVRLKVRPGELAKFGLEKPSFTIAVDRLLEDSVRRNILIGDRLGSSGDAYATIGASDAVFILDGETVKTLVSGVLAQ